MFDKECGGELNLDNQVIPGLTVAFLVLVCSTFSVAYATCKNMAAIGQSSQILIIFLRQGLRSGRRSHRRSHRRMEI